MNTNTTAAVALALGLAFAPASMALAHSAGMLDSHGCHPDRRDGAYHCHRGDYTGLHFRSKSDMLEKKSQGYSGEDQRAETNPSNSKSGLRALWPFGKSSHQEEQLQGSESEPPDATAPRDIEQRLALLKQLHDKQLISDEEFAATKRQILSDL